MEILEKANKNILRPNGYQFKLKLELVRNLSRKKNRYPVLDVSFDNLAKMRSLGQFFYQINRNSIEDATYE